MKILFSPSESKSPENSKTDDLKSNLWQPELFEKRKICIDLYNKILESNDEKAIQKLTGLKDTKGLNPISLSKEPLQKAVLRYTGVAYDYLDYKSLNKNEQNFIDKNVLIFSNLFGPLLLGDNLPSYKLKQGESLDGFKPEDFYQKEFKEVVDEFLKDEFVVDLRAGFYEKFYKITKPYVTLKFLKDNKVVSHWAKAYRGIVLKSIAKSNIQNEEEFMSMKIENLQIKEIKKQKNKTEIIYSIS
ncbi:MAG: YaaA family protein [Campylobacteraceae bacterium]